MGKLPPDHPPRPRETKGLKFDLPVTWKQVRGSAMAYATFEVRDGNEVALMKITRLPGREMMGGFAGNLGRWRQAVGLNRTTADDVAKARPKEVKVGGAAGRQLDIQGPSQLLRIVWVIRSDAIWYFRLEGPTAVVRRELANFDRFIEKLTFTGAADE
jgi:hypothetical protein